MARVLIATQPWSPITRNALGVLQIQATTSVTIANTDGSAATTWSAQTGGSSSTAAQLTDSNGNIQRWIEEGEYDITVSGESAKRVEATAGRAGPLDARRYLTSAYVPRDATVTIDLAAAIADMESTGRSLYWPGGLYAKATSKNIVMNSSQASFTYRIVGDGLDSRIYLPSGMGDGEFLLLCNQTFDGTPVATDFLNLPRVLFDQFFVVGSNSPNGGFFSTYQRSFSARRINFFSGKYGFRTRAYCDLNRLRTIQASGMTSGGWVFQQFDNGDGLTIDGFNASGQAGFNVKGTQGAVIRGLVSGWHVLDASDATVEGAHLEGDGTTDTNPLLTIKNSRVRIPDGRYYTTSYRPAIRIDDSASANYRSKVTIGHNCTFVERLDDPAGTFGAVQHTAIDLVGLSKQSSLRLESVRQDYFGRSVSTAGDGTYEQGVIKIVSDDSPLQTVINARPPLLAGDVRLTYMNGAWEINALEPNAHLRMARRQNNAVTVTGTAVSESQWVTNQASGTRFYRVWTRNAENMDTVAATEVSVTTSGGTPLTKLTIAGIVPPATLRILRGTVTGTYTEWVEFATPNETVVLRDQGTVIAGQTWSSTSVPGVTTTNDTRDMFVYRNGTHRIAYGSAAPTSGTWSQGDVMFNTAVAAAGIPGWSCTTAGSPGTWKAWGVVAA